MNWRIKSGGRWAAPALLAALLGGLAACNKGDELNVSLPGSAGIGTNYVELPLTTFTVVQQPIQTIKAQHYLVGRMQDQLTGQTTASAVLNLLAASPNDSLPGRFIVDGGADSVIVQLGYDQVYGSTARPASFDVLELAQPLDERTLYNSTTAPATRATVATGINVALNKTRTVKQPVAGSPGDTVTVQQPDRTVPLTLLRKTAQSNPNYPAVSSTWATNLFRNLQVLTLTQAQLNAAVAGLVLQPSANYSGAVLSFSRSPVGSLVVYFHELGTGKRHSYGIPFGPALSTAGPGSPADPRYFTLLTTDFQAISGLQSLAPGTRRAAAATAGLGYIQEGTGLALGVQFDNALFNSTLNQPNIAINRAELVLPLLPYSNALLSNPATLYAVEVDAQNNALQRVNGLIALDRVVQTDGVAPTGRGAEARATVISPNSTSAYYSLPITSYLQAYLTNASANTLAGPLPDALLLTPALSTASTLTLNRATIQANKAVLRVYYSRLRQ